MIVTCRLGILAMHPSSRTCMYLLAKNLSLLSFRTTSQMAHHLPNSQNQSFELQWGDIPGH